MGGEIKELKVTERILDKLYELDSIDDEDYRMCIEASVCDRREPLRAECSQEDFDKLEKFLWYKEDNSENIQNNI